MINKKKYSATFAALFILGLLFFLLDILSGSVYVPLNEILKVVTGRSASETNRIIVMQSRIPKALTALMAGATLPVAGVMMQTFFKNPLAGPDILGISSGASLLVAIVIMGGSIAGFDHLLYSNVSVILAAICGSVGVLLIILFVADYLRDGISLLIFGLMLGTAISAVVGIFQYFSEKGALKNFVLWTFGSLSSVTWAQLSFLIPVCISGIILSFFLAKWLNGLLLGESYARSMGLPLRAARFCIILLTGVLTGSVTAYCGPIVFIGIAVPHIARMLFKTTDHFILIPACVLLGMIVMLLCDIISQLPGQEMVLPINSITALMGAPFVIYIVIKNTQLNKYF